jgi:hypothetical protein
LQLYFCETYMSAALSGQPRIARSSSINAVRKAVGYAKFFSRSHDAVIRVYDEAGNAIETHEHAGGVLSNNPGYEPMRR